MTAPTPEWKPLAIFRPQGSFILTNPLYRWVFAIDVNPEKTADWVGLRPGMEVLELGPGPGYYTATIARRVDPGTVHAVELQQEMIDRLEAKVRAAGVTNLSTYCADAAGLPLKDESIDVIWALYVLEEVRDLRTVARELHRVLRPGGELAIAQFRLDFKQQQKEAMRRVLPECGFSQVLERDTLRNYRAKYRKV